MSTPVTVPPRRTGAQASSFRENRPILVSLSGLSWFSEGLQDDFFQVLRTVARVQL